MEWRLDGLDWIGLDGWMDGWKMEDGFSERRALLRRIASPCT